MSPQDAKLMTQKVNVLPSFLNKDSAVVSYADIEYFTERICSGSPITQAGDGIRVDPWIKEAEAA